MCVFPEYSCILQDKRYRSMCTGGISFEHEWHFVHMAANFLTIILFSPPFQSLVSTTTSIAAISEML